MNWKKLFDEERLNRGYNYFLEDKVYDVILTDDTVTSKVEGSRSNIYEVKINFKDDDIDSLYCTCPYFYSDFNCKHMVATLYKMEEIKRNTQSNILEDNNQQGLFIDLLRNVDENRLKRFLSDNYIDDEVFVEKFVNEFQKEFLPEDFYNYENMLENIFNIDIVELYNENGFYQEAPFNRFLKSFIDNKIESLYRNEEYSYVAQLLFIIYDNISEKVDVRQYIEVDSILESCNYYMEKIIEKQDKTESDQIFDYLINKIHYDSASVTTKFLLDLCIKKFNAKCYLNELNIVINDIISYDSASEDILLAKYELMKLSDESSTDMNEFLLKHKDKIRVLKILIEEKIKDKHIEEAIELLEEHIESNGLTHSLEDTMMLLSLYKINDDTFNSIRIIRSILYDYNIKDMTFVNELKDLTSDTTWQEEKRELIEFYQNTYSYDFLNYLYVEEEDYDELYENIINNCQIELIEEYREYFEDKYNDDILILYKKFILEQAKKSKNISGYTFILKYMEYMLSYKNNTDIVKDLIKVLKNKYKARELFMKKIEEFEIINSL